ncbi:MAG TPA: hypothetical protein VD838_20215, partial [Anaeromyxobacteraceae bacterium]|nr:hypothetical protein [Anaeromyxobacteraceae bacterium]
RVPRRPRPPPMPDCAPLTDAEYRTALEAFASRQPMPIRAWQMRLGVKADGVAGPVTRAALEAARAPQAPGALDAPDVYAALRASGVLAYRANAHAPRIAQALADYEINTPLRAAHFLAQILVETGGLRWLTELASGQAYEGRRDLGNTQKGDGPRFKGRGMIQTTGRANYKALADHLRAKGEPEWDVVSEPKLVADTFAAAAAGFWWQNNGANAVADGGDTERDVQRVSRLVNRGNANSTKKANHEAERIAAFRDVAKALREAGAWR